MSLPRFLPLGGAFLCLSAVWASQDGSTSVATRPTELASIVSIQELSVSAKARSQYEKGRRLLVEKHRSEQSIAFFQKAIDIAPSFLRAHLLLSLAYMDTQRWNAAESALRQTISLDDKLAVAYLVLGSCLVEEAKFAEAEEPLLRGVEMSQDDSAEGHYDLARTYYALNRIGDAGTHARQAVALAPNFPDAHILMGNVLLRLGNDEGALTEYRTYLRLAPKGPMAPRIQDLVQKLQAQLAAP